jgi:hypothetical protein
VDDEWLSHNPTNLHPWIQRSVGILKNNLHVPSLPAKFCLRKVQQVDSIKSNLARIRLDEAKNSSARRRFATSGFANQSESLSPENRKAYIIDRFYLSGHPTEKTLSHREVLPEVSNFQKGVRFFRH